MGRGGKEPEIRWGRRREQGPDRLARDYISFFLGDQEIRLHDFVYLTAGEEASEPYVGMVVRLWQSRIDSSKKALIRWMYRGDDLDLPVPDSCDRELFFSLGGGEGCEDTNNLECVEGKCNCRILLPPDGVEDWKPSEEETAGSEFYTYRCFDVNQDKIYGVGALKDALHRAGALKSRNIGADGAGQCMRGKARPQIHPAPEIQPAKKLKNVSTTPRSTEKPSSSRPDVQKAPRIGMSQRNLFKQRSWEDILEDGYAKNKVILLRHFDPAWREEEVKEALTSVFPEVHMDIKVVPLHCVFGGQTGEAIIVFRDNAQMNRVMNTIQENCLLLSENSGPCIALPLQRPTQTFYGHLPIEKYWRAQAEKFREAVSTSHCAQPNTIEFDMALQWRVLDERHRVQQKLLARMQEEEVNQLFEGVMHL